jgi:hypothetical protein
MPMKSRMHKQSHTYREQLKINGLKSAVVAMALGVKK